MQKNKLFYDFLLLDKVNYDIKTVSMFTFSALLPFSFIIATIF